MSEPVPSQEQLQAWLDEWQPRLRLQDWTIKIRLSEKYELDGNQARICPNKCLRHGLILINPFSNEGADEDDAIIPYEMRVIHELVHLHWELLWPKCNRDDLEWILAEQAVDSLAWGLYRAKYDPACSHSPSNIPLPSPV